MDFASGSLDLELVNFAQVCEVAQARPSERTTGTSHSRGDCVVRVRAVMSCSR